MRAIWESREKITTSSTAVEKKNNERKLRKCRVLFSLVRCKFFFSLCFRFFFSFFISKFLQSFAYYASLINNSWEVIILGAFTEEKLMARLLLWFLMLINCRTTKSSSDLFCRASLNFDEMAVFRSLKGLFITR